MPRKESIYLFILLLLFIGGFIFLLKKNVITGFVLWVIVLLGALFKKNIVD